MKVLKSLITVVCAVSAFVAMAAIADNFGEMEVRRSPRQYDSLFSVWHEANIAASYEDFFNNFVNIDTAANSVGIHDSIYEARLRAIPSIIHLPYNSIIRRYIEAYTDGQKVRMGNIIGLSYHYFPMIEEELDKQGLPLELKMLAVVESALSPSAVSRSGATGLWQFMLGTGKHVGLEINSFVDERMDPVASTRGAGVYLKSLYDIYDDWTLALAAYNCGQGTVNKALKRVPGAKTYWDIYYQLPQETRGYVPSFVAATYAYAYHKAHGIEPVMPARPISTDTIVVRKMMHLEQISSTIDVPIELLRELNPQYRRDIVPGLDTKSYSVLVPRDAISTLIENENDIYAKDSLYLADYLNSKTFDGKHPATASTTYKVKSGDVLGSIARNHGTTIRAIINANKLTNPNKLRLGQVLIIP